MKTNQTNTLWGHAFSDTPDTVTIAFTSGRDVIGVPPSDTALISYDLWVNKAHAVMLAKTGCIPQGSAQHILQGLTELETLVEKGAFVLDERKEDVHTNIESWLTEAIGIEHAGVLHTARSRNDQVAADMRLYLKDQVGKTMHQTVLLAETLVALAGVYARAPFPGFTHHQHAMTTTFGHVLLGFASMVLRDCERLEHWMSLHNHNPLGNVASYGTSYPIDRKMTGEFLGFDSPDHNSLDAITNRWEPEADFVFALSVLMNHLSVMAETIIMLSTPEFGMITLSDKYSTGSSVMPQKKNPDPLEVIKGKAAYVHGQLSSLLSVGKGAFIGYNRDSQITKQIVMDCVSECASAPAVMSGVLKTMSVHTDVMESWCHKGFIGAATLMEHIAQTQGIPMRISKVLVEKAVKYANGEQSVTYEALCQAAEEEGITLSVSEADVVYWQTPRAIIALSKSYGGPGKNSLHASMKKLKQKIQKVHTWIHAYEAKHINAKKLLSRAIESLMKGGETV